MTTPLPVSEDARPTIRADIRFSPPYQAGTKTIYYVKDEATDWFYRIGAKEYFLLSRMDGRHTLAEIGAAYAQTFGRRLDGRAWGQLFALIEQRQLLAQTAHPARLADLRRAATAQLRRSRYGLLRHRVPLLNPDALLGALAPRLGFLFNRFFVAAVLFALIVVQIGVLSQLPALIADVRRGWLEPLVLLSFSVVALGSIALHEFAHGLTCKYFGGSVREIGILWRYFSFFPYCKLDDALLFQRAQHRVATAGAGFIANALTIIPFAILWVLAPEGGTLKTLSALILTVYHMIALIDLIPFVELDGYYMLSYALGMADLRGDAHQYWRLLLRNVVFRQGEGVQAYPTRVRRIYHWYGMVSLLFTGGIIVAGGLFWMLVLHNWLGAAVAWSIAGTVLLVVLFRLIQRRATGMRRQSPGTAV